MPKYGIPERDLKTASRFVTRSSARSTRIRSPDNAYAANRPPRYLIMVSKYGTGTV